MKKLIAVLAIMAMAGCATQEAGARKLLDRLEFGADEYGSFELEGTVDISANPFVTTNVHMKLEKVKPVPVAE